MTPEDKESLGDAVKQVADHVDEFKRSIWGMFKNSMPINVHVNAGGYGTTLTLLILLSIILGFAYSRTQARLDGLYDRIDAIYMMAPQLQPSHTPPEHAHETHAS